ncbi:MAG: hypothetical protein NTW75_02210 [Planctomycetales bacterium]|nr:hypothetical protein [Planctomycetales bacterium]
MLTDRVWCTTESSSCRLWPEEYKSNLRQFYSPEKVKSVAIVVKDFQDTLKVQKLNRE